MVWSALVLCNQQKITAMIKVHSKNTGASVQKNSVYAWRVRQLWLHLNACIFLLKTNCGSLHHDHFNLQKNLRIEALMVISYKLSL